MTGVDLPLSSTQATVLSEPHQLQRDLVFQCLQLLVDGEGASWWINDEGGTELHLPDGRMFLLGRHGVHCLR